jgi:phage tail sheath gpL-like
MALTYPTGYDPTDPRPVHIMGVEFTRGPAGGQSTARKALILCNKVAGTGSGSVDGLGSALNTPVDILGGETEVINRCGYHSEALLLYKLFVKRNKSTQVALCIVPPGSGSGTFDLTFATNSNASGSVKIEAHGESIEVGIASGDTPTIVAAAVSAAINAQLHWTLTASPSSGVVTIASAVAGTRHDNVLNRFRATMTLPNAMTATKGAVTPGSTDDDQTTAISNLEGFDYYYQVNPKQVSSGVTSTDNGIGEHAAAMATWVQASLGRNCVLITGSVTTPANAVTVAQSINQPWAFHVHAEDNDWSPGQIATQFASVLSLAEATQRAAYMAGYGQNGGLDINPPFDAADRVTIAEEKTMLNGGVTPIKFTAQGAGYYVWPITTKSLTNSIADYRSRPGQVPSCGFHLRDVLLLTWNALRQDYFASDPADGETPLPNFTYPRDVRAMIANVMRDLAGRGDQIVLDPSELENMIASIVVNKTATGFVTSFAYVPVKHLLKGIFTAEDVGPSI